MFTFLSQFANHKEVKVAEPKADFKNKSTNEIIEEIHETFYTEVDRLLAEAKILKPLDTDKQDLIDKSARLKSLGFTNTNEVSTSESEIARLKKLENENLTKDNLREAINYFSFKYPHYKFITEESVIKICEKYNLVYSEVSNYIGEVPDANLEHIENFKIEEIDECYLEIVSYFGTVNILSFDKYKEKTSPLDPSDSLYESKIRIRRQMQMNPNYSRNYTKANLEICAPIKDFKKELMELKNFKLSKIEIPDPVVLKPVFFKGMKHYLIVTAWGLEASDELVANQNHN